MIEFDITDMMDELEGLSIKEKLQELDNLHSELEDAADEVLSAKEDLEEEYNGRVEQRLLQSITQFASEQHLEDVLLIKNESSGSKTYELNFDGHTYSILPCGTMGEWTLVINLKDQIAQNQKRYDLLTKFAEVHNLPYKQGSGDIKVRVEEDELFEKIKEIVTVK